MRIQKYLNGLFLFLFLVVCIFFIIFCLLRNPFENELQLQTHHPLQQQQPPSIAHELKRFRIESSAGELKSFLRVQFQNLRHNLRLIAKENGDKVGKKILTASDLAGKIERESSERLRTQINDMKTFRELDNSPEWRKRELKSLVELVQLRLDKFQNPANCFKAKKLVCRMDCGGCGFGADFHDVVTCFFLALASNRTLILETDHYRYNKEKGFNDIFAPISRTCQLSNARRATKPGFNPNYIADSPVNSNIHEVQLSRSLGVFGYGHKLPQHPPKIPEDLRPRLERLTSKPYHWWVGQLVKYLFRPRLHVMNWIKESKSRMGFTHPIVSVHVRRTNKAGEARFRPLNEYMVVVDEWYNNWEITHPRAKGEKRKVFLATDEPTVIKESNAFSKNYIFVFDKNNTNQAKHSRYTPESLLGVIRDIYFLADADFVVCTLSSNICRLAYELMQSTHINPADRLVSIDDQYLLYPQPSRLLKVILPHVASNKREIDLKIGDVIDIGVSGIPSEYSGGGYVTGTNLRTKKKGFFPTHKVEEKVLSIPFQFRSEN